MNEKNLNVFIDFGSSKVRLGVFNKENPKNLVIIEKESISNFNQKNFDINNSKETIKNLIKSAEKRIEKHINNINLMIDTPDMFSIDISIKKNIDVKKNIQNDIRSLLQETKNIIQKNYFNKKIIHMIVKKYVCDDKVFYEIPDKQLDYKSLILEIKFICFSKQIWENLQNSFNQNYLKIENIYCSSYVRSVNYNKSFENYKKKVIIDIGYTKSAIVIFEEKRVLYFNIVPVGGRHITNDISLLLKISPDKAETLKKNLNKSETIFLDKSVQNEEIETPELTNQIIFARVDEIIKLNLKNEYFNEFFNKNDHCALIFIGEGSNILNNNSIYLEEKFDFFNEISFFEENSSLICESGFNFNKSYNFQEVSFSAKKMKNKGFFEKIFHFFN